MTDQLAPDPELEPYLVAYRASEPSRKGDPFSDPRLAAIAARRAAKRAHPFWRFLAGPIAPLAPALLALAIVFAPAPASPIVPTEMGLANPMVMAGASPSVMTDVAPSADTLRGEPVVDTAIDPLRLAAMAVAAAGFVLALRRLRARAGGR